MRDASIAAIGRLFLALLFIMAGLSKLGTSAETTGFIASAGLPLPSAAYVVALVVEIGGGLLLLIGYQTRLAALALTVFTVVAGVFFHSNFADQNQMIHFSKNLAIAGGLLQIVAAGAGRMSLDGRRGLQPA